MSKNSEVLHNPRGHSMKTYIEIQRQSQEYCGTYERCNKVGHWPWVYILPSILTVHFTAHKLFRCTEPLWNKLVDLT